MPEYEQFLELASRTYESFDEQKSEWAKKVRLLKTGETVLRLVDDPIIRKVQVKRSAVGYLRHDMSVIAKHFPHVLDEMHRLIEQNFASELFQSATAIDHEAERRLAAAIRPPITIQANTSAADRDAATPFA